MNSRIPRQLITSVKPCTLPAKAAATDCCSFCQLNQQPKAPLAIAPVAPTRHRLPPEERAPTTDVDQLGKESTWPIATLRQAATAVMGKATITPQPPNQNACAAILVRSILLVSA